MNELFTTNDEQHSITKKSHIDTYTTTLTIYTGNYVDKTKKGIYELMNACIEQRIFRSETKEKCLSSFYKIRSKNKVSSILKGVFGI